MTRVSYRIKHVPSRVKYTQTYTKTAKDLYLSVATEGYGYHVFFFTFLDCWGSVK